MHCIDQGSRWKMQLRDEGLLQLSLHLPQPPFLFPSLSFSFFLTFTFHTLFFYCFVQSLSNSHSYLSFSLYNFSSYLQSLSLYCFNLFLSFISFSILFLSRSQTWRLVQFSFSSRSQEPTDNPLTLFIWPLSTRPHFLTFYWNALYFVHSNYPSFFLSFSPLSFSLLFFLLNLIFLSFLLIFSSVLFLSFFFIPVLHPPSISFYFPSFSVLSFTHFFFSHFISHNTSSFSFFYVYPSSFLC